MFGKVEHIGIAVSDIEEAISRYEKLLGVQCYKREMVESQGVETAFFMSGTNKIELLCATNSNSAIHKFIQKKGEGIHHTAFDVEDINVEMKRLSEKGFTLIYQEAQLGADNKIINFIHPKDTNGMLVEICQERIS